MTASCTLDHLVHATPNLDRSVRHLTQGVEPWLTHWRTGHGDAWRSDAEYIARNEHMWTAALLG